LARRRLDWRYGRRAGNFHFRQAEDEAGVVLGYAIANTTAPAGSTRAPDR